MYCEQVCLTKDSENYDYYVNVRIPGKFLTTTKTFYISLNLVCCALVLA